MAVSEVETWRTRIPGNGLTSMQRGMKALETTSGSVAVFQPAIVPALLQIPDYTRWVFGVSDVTGRGDADAAVTVRLERQQVLHTGRKFTFLVTEQALRWHAGPVGILAAQLNRVIDMAGMPNVSVEVIPSRDQPGTAIAWTGFNLYDARDDGLDPLVTVELPHGRVVVSDPDDVEIYRQQLSLLRQNALHGTGASDFIRALAVNLEGS